MIGGLIALVPLALVIGMFVWQYLNTPRAVAAEPLPENLCAVIGEARIADLVGNPTTRHLPPSYGKDPEIDCEAESRISSREDPDDQLKVSVTRFSSFTSGGDSGAKRATEAFMLSCKDLAARDLEKISAPLDTLGDRRCGTFESTSYGWVEVAMYVLDGTDLLHVDYTPDTDDATVQGDTVELADHVLANL